MKLYLKRKKSKKGLRATPHELSLLPNYLRRIKFKSNNKTQWIN